MAKRKRDVKEDDKKKGGPPEDEPPESAEDADVFAIQRMKLKEALAAFKLQGRGSDEELYEKTIERLVQRSGNRPSTKMLLKLFERGIAFHHDGLTGVERGAVEILFRAGFVGVLFSTSTLALGMNMPCKTVVFGIDTPKLSPLQFRQMSGRAGRRGFDPAGTVIFMALPTSKIRRLLTASLATLRGNVPYTTSFLLRLFTYVNGVTEEFTTRDEIAAAFKGKLISDKVAIAKLEKLRLNESNKKKGAEDEVALKQSRIKSALTLLKNSFALFTRHEKKAGALKEVLEALTFFNVQLLRRLQLIDESGNTTGFANIAVHLSVHEPGNLLFVHLLQVGAFHNLQKSMADTPSEFKQTLVNILAHLFTNRKLPVEYNKYSEEKQSYLKQMPEKFEELIHKYNEETEQLLIASLQAFFPSKRIDVSDLNHYYIFF